MYRDAPPGPRPCDRRPPCADHPARAAGDEQPTRFTLLLLAPDHIVLAHNAPEGALPAERRPLGSDCRWHRSTPTFRRLLCCVPHTDRLPRRGQLRYRPVPAGRAGGHCSLCADWFRSIDVARFLIRAPGPLRRPIRLADRLYADRGRALVASARGGTHGAGHWIETLRVDARPVERRSAQPLSLGPSLPSFGLPKVKNS